MMEFFTNIWNAIWTNREGIGLFFSSGQFALLVGQIALLVKSVKSSRKNTATSEELRDSIKANESVKTTVEETAVHLEATQVAQKELSVGVAKLSDDSKESFGNITEKLDAMLEALSVVYSTIRDERIRNSVASILTSARYSETQSKLELQKRIEELKSQLSSKIQEMNAVVEDAVAVEVAPTEVTEEVSEDVVRY